MQKQPSKPLGDLESIPVAWLKTVPTPIFVLGRKGKIKYCNDAFAELTGLRKEELFSMRFDLLFESMSAERLLKEFLALYRGRGIAREEYLLIRKSGSSVNAAVSMTPIYEGVSQSVTRVFGIILASRPS